MTDRRLLAANGRVAAMDLAGKVAADRYVIGQPMMVARAVVDLCRTPDGPRDRQLLLGAVVTVFEECDGWAFVQCGNGYVGYVQAAQLGPQMDVTHFVGTMATHGYSADDFRSEAVAALPFGARVGVVDERRDFFETTAGFIPKKHLRAIDRPFQDPVTVAQLHFGVPYLWGGDSTRGIDCSGLVAASLSACAIACPGDSDLQCEVIGTDIQGDLRRGDIVFWQGHVGMMVDGETMIHASATPMATVYEPLAKVTARVAFQGHGQPVARRRL
ncbi:Cell wall-associated hydrolase, NlpC family [Yoonia tamlensis]|uniref:Cell wall-associated hydrolase, NlpC family n=1 Tax=Yoonia tamlensis TaxID=390270 RepID=A0A1I6HXP3_9RHOB|nr:NlpC/P60 family protein [Yoonia tamlensis]SFR59179.1 Cell wall-associated hydrolase, NlpC family [Yoonia tamlensis]